MSAGKPYLSLWDRAFQLLDPDTQRGLNPSKTNRRDVLSAVLNDVEGARDLALRKRWKFTKSNGDVVIIRDVMEKIVGWVQRFKETGDAAVQYDPAHAALPWAAFRFLLQTTVSEVQVFSAVAGDLEEVARNLTRYRIFERLHLRGPQSELQAEIERALIQLYAEILRQLSYAVKFFSERTITRVLKSPFRTVKEDRKKELQAREHDVNQLATLADTDILRNLNATFERMSVQSTKALSEDKFNEIVAWLSVAPYHSHHQFVAESRLAGVGQWLLNHDDYLQWLTSSSPSLCYLHGIPGSGKSTLCSVVVDSMMAQSGSNPSGTPLGYFYCANPEFEKARRSCDDVLRTILFQLSINPSSKTTVKQFLCSEYERQVARSPAGKLDIMKLRTKDCVRLILELAEQDPIIIIIDGLDSVEEDDRHTLTKALGDIVSQADNVAKVFVTSRTSNRAAMIPTSAFQIQISPELARPDMKIFVKNQIDTAVKAKLLLGGQISLETREALENALLEGAGEMFLWVKLHVKQICHETIEDDVVSALRKSLPESIDQLYQKSIDSIFETGYKAREVAMKALSWVLYMREPLTPQALLATVESGGDFSVDATQLMRICHDLVVLDPHCNVVRFSHQSVQDFLKDHERFAPSSAHTLLASICLEACSRGPASEKDPSIPSDDFYVYAAMYWPVHCKMAQDLSTARPSVGDSSLTQTMKSFMFDEDWVTTLSFESWIETLGLIVSSLQQCHEMVPALSAILNSDDAFLFTLSTFGLEDALCITLSHVDSVNVNQKTQHGYTPIYLASAFGHLGTVAILASYGAELNVECGKFGSPLHTACFNGHFRVVVKLLELGANIACGSAFQTALQAAFRGGQEDVAMHLVECCSVITTEEEYEEALQGAALVGFVRVVQLLQSPKFKLLRQDTNDTTKKRLMKAVEGGQLGVIRKFLGQSTGKQGLIPPDAIAVATLHNHKSLVKFFLDQGLNVEVEGTFGTPLRTAALLDYRPLICLLLEHGANVNSCGSFGDALQAASIKGHNGIVRLLIQEGANVYQRTGFYGSALQAAAYHGQLETAEILLNQDENIHHSSLCDDVFHAAAASGHDQIIALMLRKGYVYQSWHFAQPLCSMPLPPQYVCLWTAQSGGRGRYKDLKACSRPSQYCDRHQSQKPLVDFSVILGRKHAESEESHSISQQLTDEVYPKTYPLQAAAFAGHAKTVSFLLRHKNISKISERDIKDAIGSAAEAGHLSVLEHIIEAAEAQESIEDYISEIIQKGHAARQPHVVAFALKLAPQGLSTTTWPWLREMICTPAERYQKAGRNKESLITNFLLSCETGDIQLITTILETGDYELLSAKDLESGLHLCALHGNLAIAQILLKNTSFQDRKSISGDLVFVTAAASGSVAMMKTCIHYWPELLQLPSVSALSLALTKSSENGDIEVVRYLVLELEVDVNITTPDRPLNLPEASHWNGQHPDLDPHSGRYLMPPEDTTNLPHISPLQSVLRGFVRFDPERNRYRRLLHSQQRYGQKQTFNFLIDKGANPNDRGGQSMYPIQVAAKHCPEHVVDILIAAGADTNARMGGDNENSFHDTPRIGNVHSGATDHKSALFQAAGRELSTLSLVRKLVAAGATLPSHTEEQHSLLEEALHHFKGYIAGTESFPFECQTDGKFTVTPSIAYLFQEGCAAALTFLLGQMPNVRTTSVQWGLVLQMAAFNGNLNIVELLLARGTNINRIGHYCGTALQAASSQGHEKLVQKLLDAGAHVNTIAGRWQTALRAALVGGHEKTVKLLLEHGADVDMELPKSQTGRNTSHIKEDARTDLQLAVMTQNVDIVQHLLAQGANAVLDPDGTSHPLIIASANGSVAIVKGLIQAGAPVNIHGKRRSNGGIEPAEMSPMHAASAKGHLDVVEVLLNNHANVDINVQDAGTPLTIAANIGQARIVRHLLSAGAKDSNYQAFKNGISHDHVEVVRALLDAGALADSMLPVACERGHAETIELLIESFSDRKTLETALDEAFSISGLQDSVIQILLCYAAPTAQRFIHVCAAGSLATVKSILKQRSIDINVRSQKNGDSPLQVAALHLNSEVVRFLVEEGARIESTSPGHGPPLITALEAGAGLKLRFEQNERLRSIVDKLSIPITSNQSPYFWEYETSRSEAMQFAKCDAIVELLINHGAVVADVGRPLGSPLHIACLLGSSPMVESLIQRGAETEATAGYFEKPIFAAIHGKHADIVSMLLKRAPNLSHFHAAFGTSLHYACAVGDAASVRMLLERGADATIHNLLGHTALTVALQNPYRNQKESPLDVMLSMVESIRLSDDDLIAAFEAGNISSKSLGRLLHLDKSTIFHERVMCRVLSSRPYTDGVTIKLLMPRMGGIGVTDQMLKSVANEETLKALLEHRPVSKITAEVLSAQKNLKCIELLLKFDVAAPITEELVLRVLTLREYGGVQRNVLLNLFERNPALCVTEDMLQAVDSAEELGVLLSHLKPDVTISEHTLDRLFSSCPWGGQERLRLLLNHDSSIQLTDKIFLKILQNRWNSPIYILELLLDYRPSMVVTAEMFLLVWGKSSEDGRMRIPGLLKKHGKRIQFTDEVMTAIDEAFSLTEEPLKKSLYELRAADE